MKRQINLKSHQDDTLLSVFSGCYDGTSLATLMMQHRLLGVPADCYDGTPLAIARTH